MRTSQPGAVSRVYSWTPLPGWRPTGIRSITSALPASVSKRVTSTLVSGR